MIARPALRLLQCSLFGGLTLLGGFFPKAELPKAEPLWFTVVLVGQNEREDGSWEGVDLMRRPGAAAERFQLTLSSNVEATAEVWSVGRTGEVRLHDAAVKLGRRRAYAFPSPTAFYELEGDAPLRIRVCRKGASGGGAASFQSVVGPAVYPLSDGAPFQAEEHLFAAQGCGELQLRIAGKRVQRREL